MENNGGVLSSEREKKKNPNREDDDEAYSLSFSFSLSKFQRMFTQCERRRARVHFVKSFAGDCMFNND